jgi:hypothetical protein
VKKISLRAAHPWRSIPGCGKPRALCAIAFNMTINTDFGYSATMGPDLRSFVEQNLLDDLQVYGIAIPGASFNWSESCIEGRGDHFLDGYFENYSGISVQNIHGETVIHGWMDFAEGVGGPRFVFYWDFIDAFDGGKWISIKSSPGIPNHIWNKLSDEVKQTRLGDKMKENPYSA